MRLQIVMVIWIRVEGKISVVALPGIRPFLFREALHCASALQHSGLVYFFGASQDSGYSSCVGSPLLWQAHGAREAKKM